MLEPGSPSVLNSIGLSQWMALLSVVASLGLPLAACDGENSSGQAGESDTGLDTARVDLGFGPGFADPGVTNNDDISSQLVGDWTYELIGDCIGGEDWLTFGADGSFARTMIDTSVCGVPPDWVMGRRSGSYAVTTDWLLSMTTVAGGEERWTTTIALLEEETLATHAYRRVDSEGRVFRRRYELMTSLLPGIYHQTVDVTLQFNQPVMTATNDCQVSVSLNAYLDRGGDALGERVDRDFELSCALTWAPNSGVGSIELLGLNGESWDAYSRETLALYEDVSDEMFSLMYLGFRADLVLRDGDFLVSGWDLGHYRRSDEPAPTDF